MTAPKNSPVVDSVRFGLLERSTDGGGHKVTAVERKALDHALVWLRRGKINAALIILEAAARATLQANIWCDWEWCDQPVVTPVRWAEEVSWLGKSAPTFCSQGCFDAHNEQRINAAGNEAS